jgi:hypothetical protein
VDGGMAFDSTGKNTPETPDTLLKSVSDNVMMT